MTAPAPSDLLDVAIVGAGPAGSAAAVTLARAGARCLLVDRSRFPRDKCCGDGLTTGALRRLDRLRLDPAAVASLTPVDRLMLRGPFGHHGAVGLPRRPGLFGAVARRSDLDAALVDLAAGAGAATVLGTAMRSLRLHGEIEDARHLFGADPPRGRGGRANTAAGDHVELALEDGRVLTARFLIAADGAWSPTRRLLAGGGTGGSGAGGGGARHEGGGGAAGAGGGRGWHAFRCYASGVSGRAASEMWVWFEDSLLPGYAWSFPLAGGAANVGICLRRGGSVRGRELAEAWEAVASSPFLASLLGPQAHLERARSWPIPAGISLQALSAAGGRVLFAGDAVSCADPFTGEGVGQALESGVAAAEAILAAAGDPPAAVAGYRSVMARTLRRDHKVARVLSAVMSRPATASAAVRAASSGRLGASASGRWLFEDVPRAAPITPSAWPALVGGGRAPGAFVPQPGADMPAALSPGGSPRSGAHGR